MGIECVVYREHSLPLSKSLTGIHWSEEFNDICVEIALTHGQAELHREPKKPRVSEVLSACVLLTWAQLCLEHQSLRPTHGADDKAFSPRVKTGGKWQSLPSGLCVSADNVCRDHHHIIPPQDVYGLKTAPPQRVLLLRSAKRVSLICQ